MLYPMLKQSIFFFLIWSLTLVPICLAGELPVASIVKDLSVIEAAMIVRPNGHLLLNKGSDDSVRKGDLWSIYSKGEIVLDPISGEELGSIDETIGTARITRTDKRFSEVKLLAPAKSSNVKTAQQAKRYDGIKTIFQDKTGKNAAVYEKLRANLPSLSWEYKVSKEGAKFTPPMDALLLAAAQDRLTVWSGGEVVKVYETIEPSVAAGTAVATATAQPIFKEEAPVTQTVPGLMTPGMSAKLGGQNFRSVGSINSIAYNFDMFNIDGQPQPWFVYLTKDTLYCQQDLAQNKRYEYSYKGFGSVVNVSVGSDGMIAMNIFNQREWQMQSMLLRFTTAGFQVIDKDIPYILAYIDIDNDGIKDLVGQSFDEETFYGTGVYKMTVQGSSVEQTGKIKVPAGYRIHGSFMSDMDNDNILETGFYNVGQYLQVYEQNKEEWQSNDRFGGSIQVVMVDNVEDELATARGEIVWCPAAVISQDQRQFIALVHNDPSLRSIVGIQPKKGNVSILYKANGQFLLRTLDAKFDGPVQAVFTYGNELYCTIVAGKFYSGKGKTHIIAFSLDEIKQALQ